jgi:hypothetical protein
LNTWLSLVVVVVAVDEVLVAVLVDFEQEQDYPLQQEQTTQ